MERAEQRAIVETMCKGLREIMLRKLDKVPERWEGMELRQLFADTAKESYTNSRRDRRLGMWKDYENDRLILNI